MYAFEFATIIRPGSKFILREEGLLPFWQGPGAALSLVLTSTYDANFSIFPLAILSPGVIIHA